MEDSHVKYVQLQQALEAKSKECVEWREKYVAFYKLKSYEDEQIQRLAKAIASLKDGEIPAKLPTEGTLSSLSSDLNDLIETIECITQQTHESSINLQDGLLGTQISELKTGCWKSISIDINKILQTTTEQFRAFSASCLSISKGDLALKHTLNSSGEFLQAQTAVNTMINQLSKITSTVAEVRRNVVAGNLSSIDINTQNFSGSMLDLLIDNNTLISHMNQHFRELSEVVVSMSRGDLSKKCTLPADGEFLLFQDEVNTCVETFISLLSEVSRLCREVGRDGKLGGQSHVRADGCWKDLVDEINWMTANFTGFWRSTAEIVSAVASGDFSFKITIDSDGEYLELKQTVNFMVDFFNQMVSEFYWSLKEVQEGKIGRKVVVKHIRGSWKDLIDMFNETMENVTLKNMTEL